MKGTETLAAVAAAMMAGLGATPQAMTDANHTAIYRPLGEYAAPQRHKTKAGPGRKGAHSKHHWRPDRRYALIAGKRRNLHKLIGTR